MVFFKKIYYLCHRSLKNRYTIKQNFMKNKSKNLGFYLKRTDLKNIIGANSGNMPSKCAGLFTQAQWEGCNCHALQSDILITLGMMCIGIALKPCTLMCGTVYPSFKFCGSSC